MLMLPRNFKPQPGNAHIQIGIETGQKKWDLYVNSPITGLPEKQRFIFTGELDKIQSYARSILRDAAEIGKEHGASVYGVYEAGAFGQKLGRNLIDLGITPVQLVARSIEYVRFGGERRVPKSDRIDSWRQASIPLDDPDLPWADVQTPDEEELRELISEEKRLDKAIARTNARMCAILRRAHLHARHYKVQKWEHYLADHRHRISPMKQRQLGNLLEELRSFTRTRNETRHLLHQRIKAQHNAWQPPDPAAQPARAGRHALQPLGDQSPLRSQSLPAVLQDVLGIGAKTTTILTALIGDIRRFRNKKAFRAYLGLVPMPHQSCTMNKSQGMRRGNPALRKLMIQLAWRWLKLQPDTPLANKYTPRLNSSRRSKKIAICALAGELAQMLFGYLVRGNQIPGLCLKSQP
jgi:transposase